MTYATDAALSAQSYAREIEQLLDRDGDGAADAGVLSLATSTVDAMIDGYLSALYEVPLVPAPPLVTQIACDLVRYFLWGSNPPEEVRLRYTDAMARLLDMHRGLLTLVGTTSTVVAQSTPLAVAYTTRTRTFDDDTLAGFVGT